MPARYQLHCLGEPGLSTLGGRPIKLRTRKQLALLCYLAMEPRPHTRDALAELLWPKVPQGEARHSLATAMSGLRGKLGKELFEATADRIRLRPGSVELDVDRLLKGEVLGTEFVEPLDVDGFLQAWEVPDALPFSHWRDGEHARLLPNVRDALVILIDHCRRTGDFRQIETLALRLLRFDSLSEEGIRARMEARAFAGDRLTALRLFKDWKAALARSLGAVPSPLLEGMALRLRRREWERPEAPDVPAVRTDQWRGRPFVGRGREYRQLYEAWEGTQRGEPRHRLLLGDSGIGKSTLVERLTTAAGLEGATVARVQCHEVEREIPYAMVTGLISQLVERPGSTAAPPDALAELAQTIPAVRQRFPVLPLPLESQGDAARIRFTEAAHALMAAVAGEHPVILVIDDGHHADDVSLAVLHRVVRLADKQQILMLFVARPGELHQSPQAARLRDNGASLGIHPLEIQPLEEDDARTLLDLLVAELQLTPSATVRRALLAAAAGFPLVLELLVRDWARSGALCLALSLDAVTADAGRKGEPDEAYQLLLDRLARTLDPGTRNTLHVAAVLGPRLNDSALYALADLRVSEVMTGLTTLVQYRILRDGGDHLEFANDLVRAHAYYAVPSPMRLLLHGLIADALLERAAKGDDSLGLEIAWHCMRCGRKEEATKHLLLGARASIRRGAVHEAERRLESGLGAFAGEDLRIARLLLVELLQEQSRWRESLTLLRTFDVELSTIDGECLAGHATLELGQMEAEDIPAAATVAARHLCDGTLPAQTRLRALRFGCSAAAYAGSKPMADMLLSTALATERIGWDEDEQLEWECQCAFLRHLTRTTTSEAETTLDTLCALAIKANARSVPNARSWMLLSGIGYCHRMAGRYLEAIEGYELALHIALRLGKRNAISVAHAQLAACHMALGNTDAQRIHGDSALAHAEASKNSRILGAYCAAAAYASLGQADRAQQIIAAQDALLVGRIPGWLTLAWQALKADFYWRENNRELALGIAEAALLGRPDDASLETVSAGPAARWAALLLHSGRAIDAAKRTLDQARRLQAPSTWEEGNRLSALLSVEGPGPIAAELGERLAELSKQMPLTFQMHLQLFGLPLGALRLPERA